MLQFEVECYTQLGQRVLVLGSGPLGGWQLSRGLMLEADAYPHWVGQIEIAPGEEVEFKYVLADTRGPELALVRWEADGPNRRAAVGAVRHIFGDLAATMMAGHSDSCHRKRLDAAPSTGTSAASTMASGSSLLSAGLAAPPTMPSLPVARGGRQRSRSRSPEAGERVLEALQVDASIRFGRVCHEPGAFETKYELQESVLGSGLSGVVRSAVCRASGESVAVKTLSTANLDNDQLVQALLEVENQLVLSHPNICRLLEVFEEPGQLRLVLERMRGPDLFDHLARKGRYSEADAASCVRQMVSAVAYCHRHNVCHRDLKLENFCLEGDSPDARLKLIDFGLSSIVEPEDPMTGACGTLHYVAPEVLRQRYDSKCDMWSLGVLVYILLVGRPPFHGPDDRATVRLIRRGQFSYPTDRCCALSAEAKDFVSRLLQVDVAQRMDAATALEHPWLAGGVAKEQPLDSHVLEGVRSFSRSSALKRAVLRAIAPVASVNRVAAWADQFEALDQDGNGKISIHTLARNIAQHGGWSASEAGDLCRVLAETEDEGDLVSYSAFLSACLAAHVTLDEMKLRLLFDRLDLDCVGTVSIENVSAALGDAVDMREVRSEFAGRGMKYSEFRWLMLTPGFGPSIIGLRQLLGECRSLESAWRSSLMRARQKPSDAAEAESMMAARRENLAWRAMTKQAQSGGRPVARRPRSPQVALSLESIMLGSGVRTLAELSCMTRQEKRAAAIDALVARGLGDAADLRSREDEDLAELLRPRSRASSTASETEAPIEDEQEADGSPGPVMFRTPTDVLVNSRDDPSSTWRCANALAKDGDIEAARRENIHWRKMQLATAAAGRRLADAAGLAS